MLVTSLVSDYLNKTVNNNNNMVQSVDVPIFYHNRISSMEDELFSLKWNNHKSTFADVLSVLRDQEVFVDVTLACGGKLYPAHKFVLSTCSEYFREMFTKSPCKHPIVFMKDVSGRDLEALLDFMYRGEVNVPQTHLTSLIKTAEGLQVKGLAVPDEQQHVNQSYIRRTRDFSTPRPPPSPCSSPPPPKRKRMKEEGYTPVNALNMMYTSMSPQEPNSPYDLSQKSSSSSSVSQSDAAQNERTHSVSPDQPSRQTSHQQTHPSSGPSSVSSYHNKENSPEIVRASRTPDRAPPRTSRSPLPRSISPVPAPKTPAEMNCRDSVKEESDPVPGPSGMQVKNPEEDEDDKTVIKEDLTIEEEDCDENEWGNMGNGGGSDGGDTTSGGECSHHDCVPHHYSEASNSSLSTLDPALSSTLSLALDTQKQQQQQQQDQHQQQDQQQPQQDQQHQQDQQQTHQLQMHQQSSQNYDSTSCQFDSSLGSFDPGSSLSDISFSSQLDPNNSLQCPICLKEFKVLGSLKRHYRSHINFKPFVCDICGKRFTLNQYLIEHRRTHTGERPYMCHVCGKSFAQTGTLYHHVKNVHQISWTADKGGEKPL